MVLNENETEKNGEALLCYKVKVFKGPGGAKKKALLCHKVNVKLTKDDADTNLFQDSKLIIDKIEDEKEDTSGAADETDLNASENDAVQEKTKQPGADVSDYSKAPTSTDVMHWSDEKVKEVFGGGFGAQGKDKAFADWAGGLFPVTIDTNVQKALADRYSEIKQQELETQFIETSCPLSSKTDACRITAHQEWTQLVKDAEEEQTNGSIDIGGQKYYFDPATGLLSDARGVPAEREDFTGGGEQGNALRAQPHSARLESANFVKAYAQARANKLCQNRPIKNVGAFCENVLKPDNVLERQTVATQSMTTMTGVVCSLLLFFFGYHLIFCVFNRIYKIARGKSSPRTLWKKIQNHSKRAVYFAAVCAAIVGFFTYFF